MSSFPLTVDFNSPTSSNFAFRKVSRNSGPDPDNLSVLQILNHSELIHVTETAAFNFPNFPEARKSFQVHYFELTSAFQRYAALFRSIVSLGKPEGVILEINKELGNFTLKYYIANTDAVKAYLKKIFGFLEEEIRFKTLLKKVLENQVRNQMEEQLLKRELFLSK